MDFLEKNLEDIIFESSKSEEGVKFLIQRGLRRMKPNLVRQFNLHEYGIIDLLIVKSYREHIEITVYELKKDLINVDVFLQVLKYLRAVQIYMENHYTYKKTVIIHAVLIGKTICTKSNFSYMPDLFGDKLTIYTYDYKMDGIRFKSQYGYVLSESKNFESKKLNITSIKNLLG